MEVEEWEGSDEQFLLMCIYFLTEKGDPTRYTEWNEVRFRRLAPDVWLRWRDLKIAECNLRRAVESLNG
jgi:hypothetical protein